MTIFVLFVLLLLPLPAWAATYYVSPSGTGSGCVNGGQATAQMRNTINGGIGCLSGGDTLILKDGTYNEVVNGTIPSGSGIGAETIIKAENPWGARWIGDTGLCAGAAILCFDNSIHHIIIDGIDFDGQGGAGYQLITFSQTATPSDHITIQNSRIRNVGTLNTVGNSSLGIMLFQGHSFITIRNNKIFDIGTDATGGQSFYDYGIYLRANDSIIEDNEIYNNSGFAIHANYQSPIHNNRNIIRRNNIHHNGGPFCTRCTGSWGWSGVLFASGGQDNQFYNNLVWNNGDAGLRMDNVGEVVSSGNVIYNNSFSGNGNNCICLFEADASVDVRNNICFGNGGANNASACGGATTGNTGNIFNGANPQWTNAAAGIFTLGAGSAALNAGTDLSSVFTTDFNGNTRVTPWDSGAIDMAATGTEPPPSGSAGGVGLYERVNTFAPLLRDLLTWYPVLPGLTGSRWYDLVGGAQATTEGGPLWKGDPSGRFAGTLALTGSNYANIPHQGAINFELSDPFSISLWGATTSTSKGDLYTKAPDTSPYTGYWFQMLGTGGLAAGFIDAGTNDMFRETSTTGFNDGRLHHVVLTWDGSGAETGILLYVDGRLQPMVSTGTFTSLSGSIQNTEPARIGANASATSNFVGRVTNVMTYNRRLTPADVQALYQMQAPDYGGLLTDDPWALVGVPVAGGPAAKRKVKIQ